MSEKNPKRKKAKRYKSGKTLIVKLPFELHDYSEMLSFDQIMDTLFIVGQFINNTEHQMFSKSDIPAIQEWMERNDVDLFFNAKRIALQAQAKVDEDKHVVRELMQMPIHRKERWH